MKKNIDLKNILTGIFMLLGFTTTLEAKVIPNNLFADNMVLQQQQTALPLWGTASPKKKLTVRTSWNSRSYTTFVDEQGSWKLCITTPKAGGPYTISFNDGTVTTLKNILIGEVWVCSGQSNMVTPMMGNPDGQAIEPSSSLDAVIRSRNPRLRLLNVDRLSDVKPRIDVGGQWKEASPETVASFSAVAYHFGALLQEVLDIPVGIVCTAWGGSPIEAWMSKEMLADYPNITIPQRAEDIKDINQAPATIYNGMLHPLVGMSMRGFLWYQGEANVGRANEYAGLFSRFITEVRKEWGIGDFPFYYCQIAPFKYWWEREDSSQYLREAQLKVESTLPNIGMAVLMDAGSEVDIHPARKRKVGERLCQQALVRTYGLGGVPPQSPVYRSMEIQGNSIILTFDRAPMGLTSYNRPLTLFTIAGSDRKFYPAKARIANNQVIVTSDSVPAPIAARYAFTDFAEGELFGSEGLPVSSFRTDSFPQE